MEEQEYYELVHKEGKVFKVLVKQKNPNDSTQYIESLRGFWRWITKSHYQEFVKLTEEQGELNNG